MKLEDHPRPRGSPGVANNNEDTQKTFATPPALTRANCAQERTGERQLGAPLVRGRTKPALGGSFFQPEKNLRGASAWAIQHRDRRPGEAPATCGRRPDRRDSHPCPKVAPAIAQDRGRLARYRTGAGGSA